MPESFLILKKNIRYSFFSRAWIVLINIATLPYIVSKLGGSAYGVLVIINATMGILASWTLE